MRAATLRFAFLALFVGASANADVATEAPTGFDELTNGFVSQPQYDGDRAGFEAVLGPSNGLGPLFNGTSCAQCHAGPTRNSQITNLHVGTIQNKTFFPPPGGLTMIHD